MKTKSKFNILYSHSKFFIHYSLFILILLLGFFGLAGSSEAEVIPPDRQISWDPGIPGGIPNLTTIWANVKNSPYNAVGDGIADDTQAIQNAINSCPAGQVVYIPAGTYKLTSELKIFDKGIVLGGEGPDRTFLKNYATAGSVIAMYRWSGIGSVIDILSGYTKDSTQITVQDAATLNVGDYIVVYQDNDNTIPVTPVGCGGNCGWCGLFDDENHAMTQIVRITAKNGNTLTLNRPLYFTFKATLDPEVREIAMMERAGVEDLYIEMMNQGSGGRDGICISYCAYCWVKNVETNKIRNNHVNIRYSYGNEVRHSYFHHGWGNYPGSFAYGVQLYFANSDHLIEDNIFYVLRHSMVLEGGGSGNVFGYNYSKDSQGNVGDHWLFPDMITHGAHPYMNLFEGNIGVEINFDTYWGSASHNTAFRNWVERRSSPPDDTIIYALQAVNLESNSHYQNIVGNVLCHPGCTGVYQAPSYVNAEIWHLGYFCPSSPTVSDQNVESTLLRHNNFDYISNSTQWDPDIVDHSLPNSYYLTSKPSFFGTNPWPAIGPDLTPIVGSLPAKDRYDAIINPSDTTPPSAPSGLLAQ